MYTNHHVETRTQAGSFLPAWLSLRLLPLLSDQDFYLLLLFSYRLPLIPNWKFIKGLAKQFLKSERQWGWHWREEKIPKTSTPREIKKQQKQALCAPLQAPFLKNLMLWSYSGFHDRSQPDTPSRIIYTPAVTSVVSDSLHPMDHSPPGSFVHGIFLARILEWFAMPSSEAWRIFSTQGLNLPLLCRRQILHLLSHPGKPQNDL